MATTRTGNAITDASSIGNVLGMLGMAVSLILFSLLPGGGLVMPILFAASAALFLAWKLYEYSIAFRIANSLEGTGKVEQRKSQGLWRDLLTRGKSLTASQRMKLGGFFSLVVLPVLFVAGAAFFFLQNPAFIASASLPLALSFVAAVFAISLGKALFMLAAPKEATSEQHLTLHKSFGMEAFTNVFSNSWAGVYFINIRRRLMVSNLASEGTTHMRRLGVVGFGVVFVGLASVLVAAYYSPTLAHTMGVGVGHTAFAGVGFAALGVYALGAIAYALVHLSKREPKEKMRDKSTILGICAWVVPLMLALYLSSAFLPGSTIGAAVYGGTIIASLAIMTVFVLMRLGAKISYDYFGPSEHQEVDSNRSQEDVALDNVDRPSQERLLDNSPEQEAQDTAQAEHSVHSSVREGETHEVHSTADVQVELDANKAHMSSILPKNITKSELDPDAPEPQKSPHGVLPVAETKDVAENANTEQVEENTAPDDHDHQNTPG